MNDEREVFNAWFKSWFAPTLNAETMFAQRIAAWAAWQEDRRT
jgi:hypothetical protein